MQINQAEFIKSSTTIEQCPDDNRKEYAFIGRSNVGKSTLINMLTGRKALAKISGKPGKTQTLNHFLINNEWYLVDLPGYGYAKVSKSKRSEFNKIVTGYLLNRKPLINTFLLIDSRHEPLKNDLNFMEWLGLNEIPFSLVFTKIDKLSSSALNKNLRIYQQEMLKYWETMPVHFKTSGETSHGKMEILGYIEELNKQINF